MPEGKDLDRSPHPHLKQKTNSENEFLLVGQKSHFNQSSNIDHHESQICKMESSKRLPEFKNETKGKSSLKLQKPSINNPQKVGSFKGESTQINKESLWKKTKRIPGEKFVEIYQPRNESLEKQYLEFQQQLRKKRTLPGPGQYNIRKAMVKPNYETIEKNNEVILVKVNNVDGTANFKKGAEKLTAIYNREASLSPGPGEYAAQGQPSKKNIKSLLDKRQGENNSTNYQFIRELYQNLKLKDQPCESIPSYTVSDSSNGRQYNGVPEHIQTLHQKVKQENERRDQLLRVKLLKNAKNINPESILDRKKSFSGLGQNEKATISMSTIPVSRKESQIFDFSSIESQLATNYQQQYLSKYQTVGKLEHRTLDESRVNTNDCSKQKELSEFQIGESAQESTPENPHLQSYNRAALRKTLMNIKSEISKEGQYKVKLQKLKNKRHEGNSQSSSLDRKQLPALKRSGKQKQQSHDVSRIPSLSYRHPSELCRKFGYFDGFEKHSQFSAKYNVKLERDNRSVKKLMQPFHTIDSSSLKQRVDYLKARRSSSEAGRESQDPLQDQSVTESGTLRHLDETRTSPYRYHRNMLDVIVSQRKMLQRTIIEKEYRVKN